MLGMTSQRCFPSRGLFAFVENPPPTLPAQQGSGITASSLPCMTPFQMPGLLPSVGWRACPPTIAGAITGWLAKYSQRIAARKETIEAKKIPIPLFRSYCRRLQEIVEGSNYEVDELEKLHKICSDPHTLKIIKLKLKRTARKRRSKRRSSFTSEPMILRTSVFYSLETLFHIDTTPTSIPLSSCLPDLEGKGVKENEGPLRERLIRLQQSRRALEDRRYLLSLLRKFRKAGLQQATNQGHLYPSELDDEFVDKLKHLEDDLADHLKSISTLEGNLKVALLEHTMDSSLSIPDKATKCPLDGYPLGTDNVPKHIMELLFGPPPTNIPLRNLNVYCRAIRNCEDFINIRFSWDKYLLPIDSDQKDVYITQNNAEPSGDFLMSPSPLPACWYLPNLEPTDETWRKYLHVQTSTESSSSTSLQK